MSDNTSAAITKIKNIYDHVKHRRVRQVLTAHSLKYKPDTIDTTSALKKYTNSIQIRNIKLKGLNGLS